MSKNLTKREVDYSKWYNELVVKADLAENSAVRGCMVIKPYGYAIWEKMQAQLDKMFKGYRGWNLSTDGIVAESFIQGPEYTVMIVGSHHQPEYAKIYPEKLLGIGLFHSTPLSDSLEKIELRNRTIEFIEKYGVAKFITTFIPNLFYNKKHPAIGPLKDLSERIMNHFKI